MADSDQATQVEYALVEGARILGLSTEATRKRIQRGTLKGSKRGGQWYLVLPAGLAGRRQDDASGRQDQTAGQAGQDGGTSTRELLEALRGEVDFLRAELRKKDELLMQQTLAINELAARIPRLPAPAPEAPERPLWKRVLGLT